MKIEIKKDLEEYLIEKKQIWYRCLRCAYEWQPKKNRRKKGKPQSCPHCRTRYWDKPKK